MEQGLTVHITRVRDGFDDLPLPTYETDGSAGMDLRAAVDGDIELAPGERVLIPTGIAFALPNGFEGQVRPRSGLAVRHGISMVNNPGTIDADYRGEVQVALINHGEDEFTISRGDRIAQIVVARHERVEWHEVAELPESQRGSGGFGSTGRT